MLNTIGRKKYKEAEKTNIKDIRKRILEYDYIISLM